MVPPKRSIVRLQVASPIPLPGTFRPCRRLKGSNMREALLGLEALAIVGDGETPSRSFTNNFDPDLQIFLAPVFDGIANQILKNQEYGGHGCRPYGERLGRSRRR